MEESTSKIPDENELYDTGRKKADVTINKYFDSIETIVNEQKPDNIEDDDDDDFDDNNWARFAGGYKDLNYLKIFNKIERRSLAVPINMEFIDYLRTPQFRRVMEENNISIHVNSGNFLLEETDVAESFCNYKWTRQKSLLEQF